MRLACLLYCSTALLGAAEPAAQTPAERKIAQARRVIETGQPSAQTYNELALALARRARESSDPAFYDQANEALKETFRREPDNFEGKKARVWILLGQHEFAAALREAKELNQRMPDDLMVYAMLVDAHVELGNYSEAEVAGQWLLDLRPGNVAGLTRAAYLRELFGDLEGSLEMLGQAYERTPPGELEDRAWLMTHVAHVHRLSGRLKQADAALAEALRLFRGYHYALAEMGRVRIDQKRYADAVDFLRQRYAAAPHPENLFELAEALKLDGRRREAQTAFADFEKKARPEIDHADNANRELIYYYVDHARRPQEALHIAEKEMARRTDAYTRSAYAWALWANRRMAEARQQMETALAVGLRDPKLLGHALKLGVKPTSAE
jgi:tetratricopeptide (TPR) repeat protein